MKRSESIYQSKERSYQNSPCRFSGWTEQVRLLEMTVQLLKRCPLKVRDTQNHRQDKQTSWLERLAVSIAVYSAGQNQIKHLAAQSAISQRPFQAGRRVFYKK